MLYNYIDAIDLLRGDFYKFAEVLKAMQSDYNYLDNIANYGTLSETEQRQYEMLGKYLNILNEQR